MTQGSGPPTEQFRTNPGSSPGESLLDHRFGCADFGVEAHHLLGQARDHRGGDLLTRGS